MIPRPQERPLLDDLARLVHRVSALAATLLCACSGSYADAPGGPAGATEACVVTRVVDGDTLTCTPQGRVRLIGIDAPELDQRPFAQLATEALAELIPEGTEVLLEMDAERTDSFGRTLAYVWSGEGLVNWILVRRGYAVVLSYEPNVHYAPWLAAARDAARSERLGLWGVDGFACEPREHRRGRC